MSRNVYFIRNGQMEFTVAWKIDVDADNLIEAGKKARRYFLDFINESCHVCGSQVETSLKKDSFCHNSTAIDVVSCNAYTSTDDESEDFNCDGCHEACNFKLNPRI